MKTGRLYKDTMKINIDEISVKIKFIEEKKLKAIITLDFGDFVVRGFRVQESNKKANSKGDMLWLTPPSYRDGGGRYHPMFFIPDKENLWHPLEEKIWEEYYKQKEEYYKKRFDIGDDDSGNLYS